MTKKKPAGGIRSDAWSMDPELAGVVGVDAEFALDENDPCYDKHRLHLLDENDPELIELAKSMQRTKKNITPVQLKYAFKPDGEPMLDDNGDQRVKVFAGRRRTIALRLANKWQDEAGLPRIMLRCTPPDAADGLALLGMVRAENRYRVQDPPSIIAATIADYITMAGGDPLAPTPEIVAKAAEEFGYDESSIRGYLSFGGLSVEVKEMADTGALPIYAANELKKLPKAEQAEAARTVIAEGGGQVIKRTRLEVKRRQGTKGEEDHVGIPDRDLTAILRLIDEDKKDGKHVALDDAIIAFMKAKVGTGATSRVKGLNGYLDRIAEKKKQKADKGAARAAE